MPNLNFKINQQDILIKRMKYIIIGLLLLLIIVFLVPSSNRKTQPNFDKIYLEIYQKKMDSLILEKEREINKLTIDVQKYEREIIAFDQKIIEQDRVIKDRTIELEKTKKRIKELSPTEQQQYWHDEDN